MIETEVLIDRIMDQDKGSNPIRTIICSVGDNKAIKDRTIFCLYSGFIRSFTNAIEKTTHLIQLSPFAKIQASSSNLNTKPKRLLSLSLFGRMAISHLI